MKLWKPGLVAAALAAGSMVMAVPAEAHGRRGDDAALAIGAGVLGLAVGAAIASDRNSDVYVRYDNGPRYYGGYYPPYPVYRAYPAYPVYRGYPAWRGYDPRYEQWRRWRQHERREHRRGWRGW